MALPRRAQQHCTYADYRGWGSDERYELIDGVAYAMGPASLRGHQKVLLAIARQVGDALEGTICEARKRGQARFKKYSRVGGAPSTSRLLRMKSRISRWREVRQS